MCGRFLLSLIPEEYAGLLRIDHVPTLDPELFAPRLNIAPTQQILIARRDANGQGERRLAASRWGMIPPWTLSLDSVKNPIFNARSETAWEKPMFKGAARTGRCVVPASGFYEWRKPATPGGRKQPFLIKRSDASPMFFAGLNAFWRADDLAESEPIASCVILTTTPNEAMEAVHDRMPVILRDVASIDRWLTPEPVDRSVVEDLLGPCPSADLELTPIDRVGDNRRTESGPDKQSPTLFD